MNKRKLPFILIMGLLLVWLFLPGRLDTATSAPQTPAAQTAAPAEPSKAPATAKPAATAKPTATAKPKASESPAPVEALDENGSYTTKEDVALYIHTYGHLPPNFITKKEAEAAGWRGGTLKRIMPGMCIGGDYYGNYEGLLPKAKGRKWTECDINTLNARSRGAERIVFSNDGLIYYTPDHFESFELLYE